MKKMKAQKLGLVLGINMAAACLMLQGCKATKPGGQVPPPPPSATTDRTITVISSPVQRPVAQPAVTVAPPVTTTVAPPAIPEVKPVEVAPSAVRTIKPLPPAAPPKVSKSTLAAAPAPAAASAAAAEYVVKPGDTLFLISKRTNYRQSAILAANPGLKPDRIRVGQKLKLPGAAAPAPAVAKAAVPEAKPAAKDGKVMPAAAPAPAAANTKAPVKTKSGFVAYEGPTKGYTVKSGDSLGKIAMESGISIRALKALNGLQKDNLRTGQKLKVPAEKQVAAKPAAAAKAAAKPAVAAKEAAKPAADAKAAAAKADPAVKEAAAPAPSADAAKAAEKPVEPAKPVEAAAKPVEAAPAPAEEAQAPTLTHTVKDGDDLVSIAIAYGISPSALMDINDLKPTDEIKPGQVLKLPANAKAGVQ